MAGTLLSVVAAPGIADSPVAQATAAALTVTVGGMATDSGTFHASNDGTKQTTTGTNKPPAPDPTGQSGINLGVLDQDASAKVVNKEGVSRACAGLAGDGATVLQIGEGNCLEGGKNLDLTLSQLDLSKLNISPSAVTDNIPTDSLPVSLPTGDALQKLVDQITSALNDGLKGGLDQLGNPGIVADLGAVQATCVAKPGTATGDASLADASVKLRFPEQAMQPDLTLLDIPADPDPNTDVTANLGDLTKIVQDAVRNDLKNSLSGQLNALSPVLDQTAALNDALDQISAQLAPVVSQVVSLKLNTQKKTPGAIDVTALDLRLLPAASAAAGMELFRTQVGHVTCGPSDRVADTAAPTTTTNPTVPTSVSAGYAGQPSTTDHQSHFGLYLAGLGALLLGAGATVLYRQRARS
ncbi:MAG: hypothetical protein ACR2FG_14125 [Marmoricola sp.]